MDSGLSGRLALGRLHKLLTIYLPRHLHRLDEHFHHAVGLSVEAYLHVAALLLVQVPRFAARLSQHQSPWWNLAEFVSSIPKNAAEVATVLELMSQSVGEFRLSEKPRSELFEFDTLQKRPLVKARAGQTLAPVTSLMLRQVLSLPLQVVAAVDGGRRALGLAYEQYAHSLVDRIAAGDQGGQWSSVRNQKVKASPGSEATPAEIDSLLWRAGVAVAIEHKGGHLLLTLGSRSTLRNALGPSDEEILRFPAIPRKDDGAVSHGLWQFARVAANGSASMKARFGSAPQRVFSMVTTLQPFEVDDWTRAVYLDMLLPAVGFKLPPGWTALEWTAVGGLEALAQLADVRQLDLVKLLEGKLKFSGRFMAHLAKCFNVIPADHQLLRSMEALVRAAASRYFDQEPSNATDTQPNSDG